MTIFEARVVRAIARRAAGRSPTAVVAGIVSSVALGCGAKTGLDTWSRAEEGSMQFERLHQTWPLTGFVVSTQRPTLEWRNVESSRTRIELSRTRGFERVEVQSVVEGSSWRPPERLAPGPWFWRLSSTTSELRSAVWSFRAPIRDSSNDSVLNFVQDFNSDGLADVVTFGAADAMSNAGARTYVHFGRRGSTLSDGVAVAEDINVDPYIFHGASGVPDMVGLGFPGIARRPRHLTLIYGDLLVGNEGGLAYGVRDTILGRVTGVGDIDRDGLGDLHVKTGLYGSPEHWLLGARRGANYRHIVNREDFRRASDPSQGVVPQPFPIDWNGDRQMDLLSWERRGLTSGVLLVNFGPLLSPSPPTEVTVNSEGMWAFSNLGDVDGNGYPDVAFIGISLDIAIVYGGPRLRVQPFRLMGEDLGWGRYALTSLGDVNGDGFSDAVQSSPWSNINSLPRGLLVFDGGPSGLRTEPSREIRGPAGSGFFGSAVCGCGDLDGDGFADLVVSDLNVADRALFVYRGSSAGLPAQPSYSLPRPDGRLAVYGIRLGVN